MGFRGALRWVDAFGAASQRPQRRDAIAARDEHAKLRRRLASSGGTRRDALEAAVSAAEIAELAAHLEELVSVHHDVTPTIDWRAVAATPPPLLPAVDERRSHEARRRLMAYRPDRLGLVDKRHALEAEVHRMVEAEEAARLESMGEWRTQAEAWSASCALAARMLCGDLDEYRRAIDASGCLDEIYEVLGRAGVRIQLATSVATIELEVAVERLAVALDEEAVPPRLRDERAAARRQYACAAPLRVARELFAVLPVDRVTACVRLFADADELVNVSIAREATTTIEWAAMPASQAIEQLGREQGLQS